MSWSGASCLSGHGRGPPVLGGVSFTSGEEQGAAGGASCQAMWLARGEPDYSPPGSPAVCSLVILGK